MSGTLAALFGLIILLAGMRAVARIFGLLNLGLTPSLKHPGVHRIAVVADVAVLLAVVSAASIIALQVPVNVGPGYDNYLSRYAQASGRVTGVWLHDATASLDVVQGVDPALRRPLAQQAARTVLAREVGDVALRVVLAIRLACDGDPADAAALTNRLRSLAPSIGRTNGVRILRAAVKEDSSCALPARSADYLVHLVGAKDPYLLATGTLAVMRVCTTCRTKGKQRLVAAAIAMRGDAPEQFLRATRGYALPMHTREELALAFLRAPHSGQASFRAALGLAPSARVLNQLAVIHANAGRLRQALPLLRKAHALRPHDSDIWQNLLMVKALLSPSVAWLAWSGCRCA
jgi:hypothetical protein